MIYIVTSAGMEVAGRWKGIKEGRAVGWGQGVAPAGYTSPAANSSVRKHADVSQQSLSFKHMPGCSFLYICLASLACCTLFHTMLPLSLPLPPRHGSPISSSFDVVQ